MTEETSPPAATLLFVDDEPSILSSLRRLFRPHGYQILTAESGEEGLEILARETVDLVVSDMRMPAMDGAQFLEKVRARWPGIVRILLTGYADVASIIAAINRGEIYRYITKPWDDHAMVLTVRDALEFNRLTRENARLLELTQQQNEELRQLNAGLEQKVAERTAELQQTVTFLEQAQKDLKKGFMTMVRVFADIIELRDKTLVGHSRRVADQCRLIARFMRLDEPTSQDIFLAGILHDIGKIGLPDTLLDKPFASLAAESRALVMKHPVKGQEVLMAVDQLRGAAPYIRHHHECFDGSGYPDHLRGMEIPLGARILAVANDFDALQMGTLFNRPMKPKEALTYLMDARGKRYDPAVVDAFTAILATTMKDVVEEVPLRTHLLRPGMSLSRDLMHADGYMLLAKGHVIDQTIIDQLRKTETNEGKPLTLYIRVEKSE